MGISKDIYLNLILHIKNTIYPFDSGPLRIIYHKYPKDCYVFFPNLVIQDLSDSDIQPMHEYQSKKHLYKKWGWVLDHYLFQLYSSDQKYLE